MLGWPHALAVADAHGVSAEEVSPSASSSLSGMPDFLAFCTPRIDAGEHPGDIDRLAMGAASVGHVLQTARDAGSTPRCRRRSWTFSGGARQPVTPTTA
ncbi:hypothetical protein ABT063_31500 [Streptomyces sp. NPDC002838]|uniref:imine reductase family protein n=1 Tax=Streptomyces sp. NPDC002838 TaxID=3154436 RepID=UPI00332528FA